MIQQKPVITLLSCLIFAAAATSPASARQWRFPGVPQPLEAEFVGMQNDAVVLQGENGKGFELPLDRFSPADQKYLRALAAALTPTPAPAGPGKPVTSRTGYQVKSVETLTDQVVNIPAATELHVTGKLDPITGSHFNFTAPDGWLFLDQMQPSKVAADHLRNMSVNGTPAALDKNLRIVQYAGGTVVIPQGADFPAMTVFDGKSLAGPSLPLKSHVEYDDAKLGGLKNSISSFVLKRGYTATLAENADGTGASRNYVAQDHDLVINGLPAGLDDKVSFVRDFPLALGEQEGRGRRHLAEPQRRLVL